MSIRNHVLWEQWIAKNEPHSYGRECIDVASEVMRLLDELGDRTTFNTHALVRQAGVNVGATQLSPYMAGFVREIVQGCHSLGWEFSTQWDRDRAIYRVTPVPPPEIEQKLKLAEDTCLALKEAARRERERHNKKRQWWEDKYDQLRHEITNLRRENDLLRELVPLDFHEKSRQSAERTPRYMRGLVPPWELEYQQAGLL